MERTLQKKYKNNKLYTLVFAIIISCCFIFESSEWSSLSIMIATAILLAIYVIKEHRLVFSLTSYHRHLLLFIFYSFLTVFWSWDTSATLSRTNTVFSVFLCMSVVYMVFDNACSLDNYYQAIMISGVIVSVYTLFFIGIANVRLSTSILGRFEGDNFYSSINGMGMWMAVCTIIYAHRIANTRFRFLYLTGLLPISMIAIAQSRTALIEVVFGIVLVILYKIKDSTTFSKKIWQFMVGLVLLVILFYTFIHLDVFSGLYDRMRSIFGLTTIHKEGSISLRSQMLEVGLNQFKKTPLLGIGFGATRVLTSNTLGLSTYLHNNYIEVLVSGGILGFLIYYSIYWTVIKELWRARNILDPRLQLSLILLLVSLVGDLGTVSYYKKPTYIIFTLVYLAFAISKRAFVDNNRPLSS